MVSAARVYRVNDSTVELGLMVPWEVDGFAGEAEGIDRVKEFAGVEDAVGIEGFLDALHGLNFGGLVLEGEVGRFGEADTMFAGDGATEFNDLVHEGIEGHGGAFGFGGVGVVVEDMGMKVAVGGVTEGWGGEGEFAVQLVEEIEEGNLLGKGDDDILIEFSVPELEHSLGTGAADLPEILGGLGGLGGIEGGGVGGEQVVEGCRLSGEAGIGTIQFEEKDRRRFCLVEELAQAIGEGLQKAGILGAPEAEGAIDGLGIEELDGGGLDGGPQEEMDRGEGGVVIGKDGEGGVAQREARDEAENGTGDHAEGTLAADPEIADIKPCGELAQIGRPADKFAGGEETFKAVDIVAGDAVFGPAESAGIGGDGTADGGEAGVAGIRGIAELKFGGGLINGGDGNARLDISHAGERIDMQFGPEGKVENPTLLDGGGGASSGGAGTAGSYRDAEFIGEAKDGSDGIFIFGEEDSIGEDAVTEIIHGGAVA